MTPYSCLCALKFNCCLVGDNVKRLAMLRFASALVALIQRLNFLASLPLFKVLTRSSVRLHDPRELTRKIKKSPERTQFRTTFNRCCINCLTRIFQKMLRPKTNPVLEVKMCRANFGVGIVLTAIVYPGRIWTTVANEVRHRFSRRVFPTECHLSSESAVVVALCRRTPNSFLV